MASYTLSRSAVAGPSSHPACLRFPFASASTSFHHSSSPRRSFSSSLSSPSAKKRHKVPFVPAATTHSKISFKSKPNSYYPQNQFQPEANKSAEGIERQTHKKAFQGAFFVGSAANPENIPPKGNLQEILFAGRSNTGKSTLLNALLSSDSLVKTSSKPGHTKMLNFFQVPDQMVLVDAPGYGERGRPEWGDTFQFYLTHRPPSPPSLLVLLFTLSHKLAPSDLLFLASLPPSIPLLPVFTKTDLCPIHDIAEKKKSLENAIQAARQSAFLEAEEREKRRRLARLSEEFDSGKDASAGLGPGGAEKEVVKGKTWEGMCVSTKKGWVLRDKTVDAVRSAILSQLQSSLATDKAHRAAHEQALYLRKQEIKTIAAGDRSQASRLLNALQNEQKQALDDFFATVPGAETHRNPRANQDDEMAKEDREADEWEEEARRNARFDPDPLGFESGNGGGTRGRAKPAKQAWGTKDPFIGSAFGRTKRSAGSGQTRNWARR